MIELHPDDLIGKGGTRCCYRHPHDPDRCIKIDHRKRGGATAKEAAYYRKLPRIRPDLSYTHIPRFHGIGNRDFLANLRLLPLVCPPQNPATCRSKAF